MPRHAITNSGWIRFGRLAWRLAFSLALLLAPFVTIGCRRLDPVVKVGLVAPFEGRHRAVGYDVLYSARLAVREINAAGGINGTRVALVTLDDSGNPEFAAAAARSLVIDPDIVAVVGHWLPETTEAAQPTYAANDLFFLPGGQEPFTATGMDEISEDFYAAYTSITPFDEVPGLNALPAYDAFQLLWDIFARTEAEHGTINRITVKETASETP